MKFKRRDGMFAEYEKHTFDIYDGKLKIGSISYFIKDRYFVIGLLLIDEPYKHQGYGRKVVAYILKHFKIKAIVGETIVTSRGFWRKMCKEFDGVRKNITYSDDCTSAFIIPKCDIETDILYDYLEKASNCY